MLRTRVGYCGGTKANPTYLSLGDHTEAIAIDFDPTVISYEELLQRFWDNHYCASNISSRQYMNVVFYHDESQKALIERTRAQAAAKAEIAVEEVKTAVLPAGPFTYAETYHQKYTLSRHPELREFLGTTYPSGKALADSTVATRLNAWLGSGFDRDPARIESEIDRYGLPPKLRDYVLSSVRARLP